MSAVFLFPLLDDKHWVLLEVTIVHGKRGDIRFMILLSIR